MTRARDLADYVATGVTSSELDILDGLTATVSELNLIDGGTSRGTTAVADGDGFLTNDNGTMRMTSVDTLATYMQNKIIGGSSITTVGTLDSGAISSGFGNIDSGSSTITTTGLISGGSLDIDNVLINGTTIGHTDDTDLITLADGVVTVAGEVSMTTLDIGGTNVTATAAELNILDGVTASATDLNLIDGITNGTVIASKAIITDSNKDITGLRNVTATGAITGGSFVIGSADINENDLESIDGITAGTIAASKAAVVDSNKDVTGFRNITLTGELDAGSLDVSGDADIDGTLEADAITVNGTSLADTITGTTVTNATNAAHVSVADNENTNEENLIPFIEDASATGNVGLESDGDFSYNPSTGTVTATIFKGNIDAVDGDFDGTLETDNLTIGGAQGSDGQVLTSTGSGVGWESIPGGGLHKLINTTTLSSAASSLVVTGITNTYDQYAIRAYVPSVAATCSVRTNLTNDSGTLNTDQAYEWSIQQHGSTSTGGAVKHTNNAASSIANLLYAGAENNSDGFVIETGEEGGIAVIIHGNLYNPHTSTSGRTRWHLTLWTGKKIQHLYAQHTDETIEFGGFALSGAGDSGAVNFNAGSYIQLWGLNKT